MPGPVPLPDLEGSCLVGGGGSLTFRSMISRKSASMTRIDDLAGLRRLPKGSLPVVLLGGLNVVRALGLGGIPVIVASADNGEPARHSRHCAAHWSLPPLAQPAAMLDRLESLAARLAGLHMRMPPLFFSNDEYLRFVLEHRERLERRFSLLLSDDEVAHALLDKARFADFARERGLPVPEAFSWDGADGPPLAGHAGPVLVKPAEKLGPADVSAVGALFGANKALVRENGAAVLGDARIAALRERLVFQEYVEGDDRELWCFDAVADEHGAVLASHTGRKLRCAPPLTGDSSYIELARNEELDRLGRDIAAKLPLRGIFNMDLKRDARTGRWYLLEVNARCNLWLYMGAMNGVNLARVLYRYLLHRERPGSMRMRPRYRWIDFALDRAAYRDLARAGKISRRAWLASLLQPKVYSVFAWHDPAPLTRMWAARARNRLARAARRLSTPQRPAKS